MANGSKDQGSTLGDEQIIDEQSAAIKRLTAKIDHLEATLQKADWLADAIYMRETPEFLIERRREYMASRHSDKTAKGELRRRAHAAGCSCGGYHAANCPLYVDRFDGGHAC